MDYQYLTMDHRDHIGIVTFNRPDKMNALSIGFMTEIERLTEDLKNDIQTRVVIFTGAASTSAPVLTCQIRGVRRQPITVIGKTPEISNRSTNAQKASDMTRLPLPPLMVLPWAAERVSYPPLISASAPRTVLWATRNAGWG